MAGDFSTIFDASKKTGKALFNSNSIAKFYDTLDMCGLIDMGNCGLKFMWHGPLFQNYERIFKRLDKAICNVTWRVLFPKATTKVLMRIKSDHHSILIISSPLQSHGVGAVPSII